MKTKTVLTAGALFAAAMLVGGPSLEINDASAETAWSGRNFDRPLTMPGGTFYAGGLFLSAASFDLLAAGVQGGYALSDELELYGVYALGIDPSSSGTARAGAGYAVVRGGAGGKLELIARADLGYDIEASGIAPLVAGLQMQYNLSTSLAIVMPATHLSVALDGDPKPITFGVPVGVLFQVNPTIYTQLDTQLAVFNIADSANAFIFADATPVAVTAAYNSMTFDLGVTVGTDLSNSPGDAISAVVFARYHGGVQ
jgi:hypothetical protein